MYDHTNMVWLWCGVATADYSKAQTKSNSGLLNFFSTNFCNFRKIGTKITIFLFFYSLEEELQRQLSYYRDQVNYGADRVFFFFFFIILCRPVNIVCWKRAICLEFMDKVRLFILFSIRKIEHLENEGLVPQHFGVTSCHKFSFQKYFKLQNPIDKSKQLISFSFMRNVSTTPHGIL